MKEKIEKVILELAEKSAEKSAGSGLSANASMQLTQAALNLAHVLAVLKDARRD